MLDTIKTILKESNKIVFITGLGAVVESGGRDLWESSLYYSLEKEYNMSPETLLSAGEYSSRKERFYKFYKKEVLSYLPKPNELYDLIKNVENEGRLEAVLSFNIFGLEKLAGIKKLVEIDGTIYDNYCPKCFKKFNVDYLLSSPGIPVCDTCKKALRPNIRLLGERVDNDLYTMGCVACTNADTIVVLGCDLGGSKIQYVTGHYKGCNLILLANEEHYSDKYADYVMYGNITDNLKNVLE